VRLSGIREDCQPRSRDRLHAQETVGGSGQFAEVKWSSRTRARRRLLVREPRCWWFRCQTEYIPGVEKGINRMDSRVRWRVPVIDFQGCAPSEGKYHDVDSVVLAFEIAARHGMPRRYEEGWREDVGNRSSKVEVVTPEDYTGGHHGDLTIASRSGAGSGHRGNAIAI